MKKVVAVLHQMKKILLDNDYTLYDNGEVLHEFDNSTFPGGQGHSQILSAKGLKTEIKEKLLANASDKNKELVKSLLGLE
ncbi:MAG: hypothetical protein RQ875_14105 [Vicingaceae bacterium]|nr:hypothetical protein [Vicingaceae bacterium]